MPYALVKAFIAMLPRLQAEEQLAAIESAQLGGGLVEQKDMQRRVHALEREALGGRRPRQTAAPDPGALADMGIGMTLLEPAHG